jgi:hypothetical protein
MLLFLIFLIHMVLCVIKSKINNLSGLILLLNGIYVVDIEYLFQLPQLETLIAILVLVILYTICTLRIMISDKLKNILKCLVMCKTACLKLNYLLIIYEEFAFRVILCYVIETLFVEHITLISQLLIMGFSFTIVHSFENKIQKYEFMVFSMLLSGIYLYTHNFLLIVTLHIIRNYSILCMAEIYGNGGNG